MSEEETSALTQAKLEKTNLGVAKVAMTDSHDVTFMVTATEKNVDYIRVRLTHLMAHQQFNSMTCVLVVDTHSKNLSESFLTLLRRLQSDGLVDSWSIVDY